MGLGIGPSIGSAVYGTLHFAGTMYLFAFFDFIGMIICIFCIPNQINKGINEQEQN
jgi:hypothetical protein